MTRDNEYCREQLRYFQLYPAYNKAESIWIQLHFVFTLNMSPNVGLSEWQGRQTKSNSFVSKREWRCRMEGKSVESEIIFMPHMQGNAWPALNNWTGHQRRYWNIYKAWCWQCHASRSWFCSARSTFRSWPIFLHKLNPKHTYLKRPNFAVQFELEQFKRNNETNMVGHTHSLVLSTHLSALDLTLKVMKENNLVWQHMVKLNLVAEFEVMYAE